MKQNNRVEILLIEITTNLLKELHPEIPSQIIKLQSNFETELGLGSLEKAELFHRIETKFHAQFNSEVIINAQNLNDILGYLSKEKLIIETMSKKIHVHPTLVEDINVSNATTLNEVLELYANTCPHRPHIYLQNDDNTEALITYGELWESSSRVANALIERNIKAGDTVALMLPTCKEFFFTFFGILLSGAIPVPIYPPFRADRIEEYAKREVNILANAEIRILVTFEQAEHLAKILQPFVPSLKEVIRASYLNSDSKKILEFQAESDYPAFVNGRHNDTKRWAQ